ncbi:hypothetical protein HO607_02985 [Streptococcus suis]|nr:hypothetical protein [Streptococcus suis]
MQNIAIEPIYQKETEYKICCFFGGKSRSGGIEKKVDKICLDGDVYELHTVKLTKKDIRNLNKGDALMFFNKDCGQVIVISNKKVDKNDE